MSRSLRLGVAAMGLILLATALASDFVQISGRFFGDEAVYYCMADSLAHDGDLRYDRGDLERTYHVWREGPQGVLLKAVDEGAERIYYAKPILYPLVVAPFQRLLGPSGFLVLHALLVTGAFALALSYLSRRGPDGPAVLFATAFVFLSAAFIYAFEIAPEYLTFVGLLWGCCLLFPAHGDDSQPTPVRRLVGAALLFGLMAASRPPNAVYLLPLTAAALAGRGRQLRPLRRWLRPLAGSILPAMGGIVLLLGLTWLLTGDWLSHGGFRKRVVGHFPFEGPGINFLNTGESFSTRTIKFVFHWQPLLHNCFYFLFGRFTGIALYYFPALAAAAYLIRRRLPDLRRASLLVAAVVTILFHLVLTPTNYHGGSGAVGNRYFMSIYPLMLCMIPGLRRIRGPLVTLGVSALLCGSLVIHPFSTARFYSQHAKSPPFTWFPVELSLLANWPTDDPGHSRITIPGTEPGYMVYLPDDNTYGRELDGFWVRAEREATLAIRAWEPHRQVRVRLRNGGNPNRVRLRSGSQDRRIALAAGEEQEVRLRTDPDFIYYNLAGAPSYVYRLRIHSESGFVPQLHGIPGDTRYLGCHAAIELGPPPHEAAEDLLRTDRREEALKLLGDALEKRPEDEQIRLALAEMVIQEDPDQAARLLGGIDPEADRPLRRHAKLMQLACQLDGPAAETVWLRAGLLRYGVAGPLVRSRAYCLLEPDESKTTIPALPHPAPAVFGGQLELMDFALSAPRSETSSPRPEIIPGDRLKVRLRFQALRVPEVPYASFVHLLPTRGGPLHRRRPITQGDLRPAFRFDDWRPGDIGVLDLIIQTDGLPAGEYRLVTGLWDPDGSEDRLKPATDLPTIRRAVEIGRVVVTGDAAG